MSDQSLEMFDQNVNLLKEIFITPSNQVVSERFNPENNIAAKGCQSGGCTGKCSSGSGNGTTIQ